MFKKGLLFFIIIGFMSACSKSRMEPNRQQVPFPNDRDGPGGGGENFPDDWFGDNDKPEGGNDGLGSQGQPSQPTDPSVSGRPRIDCPLAAGQAGLATTTRRTALDDILPFSTDEPLHPPAGTPQRLNLMLAKLQAQSLLRGHLLHRLHLN